VPVESEPNRTGDGDVVDNVLGLGGFSFVGLDRKQSVDAVRRYAAALVRRPSAVAQHALRFTAEELSILTGTSERTPDPKDRRFADPVWQGAVWKRVAQSYLAFSDAVMSTVDEAGLDPASADRARFGLMQITEALAPTNNLVLNPTAMKRAAETRGQSLRAGGRHLLHDLRHNNGIPSQVDTRPFVLGDNMAATPGAVIRRTEQTS
jgi:polyhydroxyalkanoate synthase